jgi:predicted RNA-binding Zn ribbon-like protein
MIKTEEFQKQYSEMSYNDVLSGVKAKFPNLAKKHYTKHMKTPLEERNATAKAAGKVIRRHFAERQDTGFQKRKKAYLPNETENNRLEMLADYILAEDHAEGLQVRRKPFDWDELAFAEQTAAPQMGEGAAEYAGLFERGEIPADAHIRICDICEFPFIDPTKNRSKKRCGELCHEEHERRRQRAANKNNPGDHRYKRERERQQLEYGFYSPVELQEIERYGESIYSVDSFDYGVLANKLRGEDVIGCRKKDNHTPNDDWYEDHERQEWDDYYNRHDKGKSIAWGEVTTYQIGVDITEDELESMKFSMASKMPRITDLGR